MYGYVFTLAIGQKGYSVQAAIAMADPTSLPKELLTVWCAGCMVAYQPFRPGGSRPVPCFLSVARPKLLAGWRMS